MGKRRSLKCGWSFNGHSRKYRQHWGFVKKLNENRVNHNKLLKFTTTMSYFNTNSSLGPPGSLHLSLGSLGSLLSNGNPDRFGPSEAESFLFDHDEVQVSDNQVLPGNSDAPAHVPAAASTAHVPAAFDDEMDWLLNADEIDWLLNADAPHVPAAFAAPEPPSTRDAPDADAPHVPAAFAAPEPPSTSDAPDADAPHVPAAFAANEPPSTSDAPDASKFALWLKSILAYLSVYITLQGKGMEGIWFTLQPNTSKKTGLYKSLGGHDNKNNGFARDCRTNLGIESAMSPDKTTVLKGTYRFNSIIAETFLEVIIKAKYHDMIKSISEQDSENLLSRKDKTFMVYVPSEASTKGVAQPKTLDAVQELFEKKNNV